MSATLGPIHNWVFNKIKFQEKEIEALLQLEEGLNGKIDAEAGIVEKGELAEIIDIANIHGFLQMRINITEKRLALTVESLLSDGISLDTIKQTVKEFAESNCIDGDTGVQKAYEYLNGLLVNGMPCDKVETVIENSEYKIVYVENLDIHTQYWNNKETYQVLKDVLIEGLLSKTNLSYSHEKAHEYVIEAK